MKSIESKRIGLFIIIEFILVFLVSLPLFVSNIEKGSPLVMVTAIIFMWLPAIATLVTKKITKDKTGLLLKIMIRENWKAYIMAAFVPGFLIVLGAVFYFCVFPEQLDLSLSYVQDMIALSGESVKIPQITVPMIIGIAILLIFAAPFVFINHILAFGEEVGWRAYLLPLLVKKFGVKCGIMLDGVLWGIVHAPLVYFGVNYAGNYVGSPWTGMLMMIVFATSVGILLSYLTWKTKSIFPACICHGAINAIREAPLFICSSNYSALLGPKPSGLLGMVGFIVLGIGLMVAMKSEKYDEEEKSRNEGI